jgi:hypothetical protein
MSFLNIKSVPNTFSTYKRTMFSMSATMLSGCPSIENISNRTSRIKLIVVKIKQSAVFQRKKILPTATLVNPGKSISVKFTTVNK